MALHIHCHQMIPPHTFLSSLSDKEEAHKAFLNTNTRWQSSRASITSKRMTHARGDRESKGTWAERERVCVSMCVCVSVCDTPTRPKERLRQRWKAQSQQHGHVWVVCFGFFQGSSACLLHVGVFHAVTWQQQRQQQQQQQQRKDDEEE